jgi:hypothetical protein
MGCNPDGYIGWQVALHCGMLAGKALAFALVFAATGYGLKWQ